jgi:PAS domain S-box-containing protein
MTITGKIGTFLSLLTLGSLIGVASMAVFLSSTSRDGVLLIACMMEMNLVQRVHIQALRVQNGQLDSRRELEQLVASFDVLADIGSADGGPGGSRSIDDTLTELVLLPNRDVDGIARAADLIHDGLTSVPADIRTELDVVVREWAAVRPDLVLLYESAADDPTVPETGDRIDARIGRVVRALEVLQGAVGLRLQFQRARVFNVMGAIAIASIVLLVFGIWMIRRYIARPIRKLEAASRRVREGDFSQRLPLVSGDELAMLSTTFNSMLDDLERLLDASELSERRYRELFDNANDLVCIADLDGRFTSINKAAERISGYSHDEALDMRLQDLVAPEYLEVLARMMQRKIVGSEQTVYEVEIVSKDGKRVPLELSTRLAVEDGRPVGVEGIGRDISERRNLQEQLWLAQKMDAVGRLAGGIAHDFGNVLTIVTGYCALLLSVLPEGDPVREQVEGIQRAADRGTSLTNQILSFSRGQFVQSKRLPLNRAVADQAEMLWRVLGENVELATVLNPKSGLVMFDPGQLDQVILNLALNSRDAMPDGGQLTLATSLANVDEDDPAHPGLKGGAIRDPGGARHGRGHDARDG